MILSKLSRTARRCLAVFALATGFVFLAGETATAQYFYGNVSRIAPGTRGFKRSRMMQQQLKESLALAPAIGPFDHTYSWYAIHPEALMPGVQKKYVTIVGPDGQKRTYEVQGPVIINPNIQPTRQTYTYTTPPTVPRNSTYSWYQLPRRR